jgi:hypothetical protein
VEHAGTVPVRILVMEMQTGSTNNHISQIFCVCSTIVLVGLVSSTSTNGAL